MRKIFANIPEAIDNTAKIADECNVTFTFGELHLPEFNAPDGLTNTKYLRKLCEQGLSERYPEASAEEKKELQFITESQGISPENLSPKDEDWFYWMNYGKFDFDEFVTALEKITK